MPENGAQRTAGPVPTWVKVPAPGEGFDRAAATAAVHGVLEAPARGTARCAVLLVHPVGREQVVSLRAMVALSHELALRGALVLRITLRGTGDSHPAPDDLPQAWREDVEAGLAELRRRAPGVPVHAVGLTLGAAALATVADAAHPPQRAVLWEPVGGRVHLRKAAALRRMSVPREPVDASEGTETAGELYSPAQAAALKTLPDPAKLTLPPTWQIRVEEDRDVAELTYAVGSEFARVPRGVIQYLAVELTEPTEAAQVPVDMTSDQEATLVHDGVEVLERLVCTDGGHPGVLTAPSGSGSGAPVARRDTAVFMVSAAAEPADGPTGLWTVAARDLAAAGLTVLRTDRPRCGVLTDPLEDDPPVPYEREAVRAVAEDARWLAERTGSPVTGVGLCVGSWLLLRAGAMGGMARVIAFNNIAWRTGTAYYQRVYTEIASWDGAPAGLVPVDDDVPGGTARVKNRVRRGLSLTKAWVETNAPPWIWHQLGRTGLVDAPSVLLGDPAMPPAVDLVLGKEDHQRFEQLHGPWAVSTLASRGRRRRLYRRRNSGDRRGSGEILLTTDQGKPAKTCATTVVERSVPELDHALLSARGRALVRTILLELLVAAEPAWGSRPFEP